MHGAAGHAVALERAQLLGEHLRRDPGEGAFELREAPHFAREEEQHEIELPACAEDPERLPVEPSPTR
jgi:hypothetical protein